MKNLLDAEWTNDCQGKKDYDGEILSISTRYWPRGGGSSISRSGPDGVSFETNADQTIPPSAHSSLRLLSKDDYFVTLAEFRCEGETFAQVAAKVEVWAQEQYERAVVILMREFKASTGPEEEE